MDKSSIDHPKNWLQNLKDESWEAELLISAIAIFGTIKLFDVVDWSVIHFINSLQPDQYYIAYAITFGGLLAISILTTMFVIHFLLRAYWVGLVGLNSVFPDYGLEDSVYSEIYTKKMLGVLPKLKETVHQVDELCSVIYAAAFFMMMLYLYLSLTASIYLFLFNFLSEYVNEYILLIPLLLLIVIMILQVLFGLVANFKIFKRNKTVQLWFFKISKLGSMLMFGPLYKLLLQISMTFASNFGKKKSLVGLVSIFIVIGLSISMIQFDNSKMPYLVNQEFYFNDSKAYHGYYSSKSDEEEFLLTPQIESDIIDAKVVQLFIPVYKYEKQLFNSVCGEYKNDKSLTKREQIIQRRAWYLNCYNTYHHVFFNGEKVDSDFIRYDMPKTNQFGIIHYLSLDNAKNGRNTIKIIKRIGNKTNEWIIPFQYISN